MAKILLVEDDNNLREIYEARLQAEGYEIVSAPDGETALAVAKKEQPELVISDVMMPRISGFEMLDIMRNTEGLRDVKVIMLTALGQAEDKTRADTLGADRYLVKSQVTLEDIVKSASDLLNGVPAPGTATPATAQAAEELNTPGAVPNPVNVAAVPVAPAAVMPAPDPVPAPMPAPAAVMPVDPVGPTPDAVTPVAPAVDPSTAMPAPAPAPAPMFTPPPDLPTASPAATTPLPDPGMASRTPDFNAPAATTPPPADASSGPTADAPDASALSEAVKDLIDGTAAESAPMPGPTTEPVIPAPAPDITTQPDITGTPAPESTPVIPDLPTSSSDASTPVTDASATPEAASATDDTMPSLDSAAMSKKKTIQPLDQNDSTAPPPADLHDLLAKEGLDHNGEVVPAPTPAAVPAPTTDLTAPVADAPAEPEHPMHTPAAPHQPGHVISPNPTDANGNPVDPNNISL
ncbi:MAG TPA: response regulator [Candidatus Saccharimonadales bacterium]|nr:response regulator [Candidatus Saccharimonadales bacterium]